MLGRSWRVWLLVFALMGGACSAGDGGGPTTVAPATSEIPPTTTTSVTPTSTTAPTLASMATEPAGATETVELTMDGVSRGYLLYVPPDATPDPSALVVDLHGFGSDPERHNDTSRMRQLADAAGFVVVQPLARGDIPTWNGQPETPGSDQDVAFVRAIVADVASRTQVDAGAVFATGFSNGGGMAHRLACDAADLFAAVGVVAGQFPQFESCSPSQPVGIMAFHGTDDLVVPIAGLRRVFPDVTGVIERWAERNECAPVPARRRIAPDVVVDTWSACGGEVEVVLYTIEGGGHAWPGSPEESLFATTQDVDATQTLWAFFESHRRG